jgi:hypothetical protein
LADIDIVVTDYFMPGETGLWLLERICERSHVRVSLRLDEGPIGSVDDVDYYSGCAEIFTSPTGA